MAQSAPLTVAQVYDGGTDAVVTLAGVLDGAAVSGVERRLARLLSRGVSSVVIEVSGLRQCDCRFLVVLERARRRLHLSHGVLQLRGLDPAALTGFDTVGLPAVLAAYRASLTLPPRTPQATGRPAVCSPAVHRMVRACAQLGDWSGPGVTEGTLATRLVSHCLHHLGVTAAAAVLLGEHHDRLRVAAATNPTAQSLTAASIAVGHGPAVACVHTGELISAPNLAQDTRWSQLAAHTGVHQLGAVFAVPLRHHDHTIGALELFHAHPGPMPADDLDVAAAFAELTSTSICTIRRTHTTTPPDPYAAARVGADQVLIGQAIGVLAEREHLTVAQATDRITDRIAHDTASDPTSRHSSPIRP